MSTFKNKFLFIFIILLSINFIFAIECGSMPSDNCEVTQNTTFVKGNYFLPNGIRIMADGIILDCNNSILIGTRLGNGIRTSYDYNTIKNCKIINYSSAIYLVDNLGPVDPEFNTIIGNTFEQNYYGVHFYRDPEFNNITKNILKNNSVGIYFQNQDLTKPENNKVYHNNFVDNLIQASALEPDNQWDISGQGNYWDNYDSETEGCLDDNFNFICDAPYNISQEVKDYFPYKILDAWLGNTCTGEIQVIVEDSDKQPIENIKVFLNQNFKNITDNLGTFDIKIADSCNKMQTVEVKCSDDSFCDTKNISIDFPNEKDSVIFDCSMCLGKKDLFISQQDVTISSSISKSIINATINSINIDADNLTIRFQTIGKDGLIKNTIDKLVVVNKNSKTIASVSLDLTDKEYVTVYIDPEKKILEPKTNNFVQKSAIKMPQAYLDINTGIPKANEAIKEFLESFVESVSENNAEIILSIGKFSQNIKEDIIDNQEFINQNNWGYKNEKIFASGQYLEFPYNGITGTYKKSGKEIIVALGTEIDGTIAATKKIASKASTYLNEKIENKPQTILDKFDLDAIKVYDILHNKENSENYLKNNDHFKTAIKKALGQNSYDISIKRVNTTNENPVTLRIKNINSELSQEYKDAIIENPMPVIFSGGLWSNLFRFEEFGKELASEGRDAWLIEITGGPLIERPQDLNYNYSDLVDSHWPASIAAIQYHSNQTPVQYVGFSNGCRVALSSLEKYQDTGKNNIAIVQNPETGNFVNIDLKADPSNQIVDTFVGIGCPGAFEGTSFLIEKVKENPNSPEELLEEGVLHPSMKQVASKLSSIGFLFEKDFSISLNLWKFYNSIILSEIDKQPGNFSVKNALVIYGYGGLNSIGNEQDDGLVTVNDLIAIANNINSKNTDKLFGYKLNHKFLPDNSKVKEKIKEMIQNE